MCAGNAYEFAGYSQPEVQYKGNAVKTTARGKRRVKFADGTVVEITYPKYYLRGDKAQRLTYLYASYFILNLIIMRATFSDSLSSCSLIRRHSVHE